MCKHAKNANIYGMAIGANIKRTERLILYRQSILVTRLDMKTIYPGIG